MKREAVRGVSTSWFCYIAAFPLDSAFHSSTHTLRPWNGVSCCAAAGAAPRSAAATASSAATARAGPRAAARPIVGH